MCRMLLVWSAVWLGLLTAPSRASRKYLNYTGDIMLGALFPIHHKGSGGADCGKIQVSLLLRAYEPGSSVSIVSGYGLNEPAIEVRSLAEATNISSSLCIHICSGAHPASWTMGTGGGGRFSGAKARPRRNADHSPPSSAGVENE
jgi:hypothetical protein